MAKKLLTMRDVVSRLRALSPDDAVTVAAIEMLVDDALHTIKNGESEKHNYWDPKRPTIAVDFDGVIHSSVTPWEGAAIIRDPPLPGAIHWLVSLVEEFNVLIFSARCNDEDGIAAMKNWFVEWKFPQNMIDRLRFEPGKPSAHVFVDDRAIQFDGSHWSLYPEKLRAFKPWYYGVEFWRRARRNGG